MTTLPQTTTPRLPRPIGGPVSTNGALAAPGGAHAPAATGMSAADIWRVIRANLWLIIGSLVLSSLLGYGVNWFLARNYSRFTAKALVGVAQPFQYDPITHQ